MWQKIKCFFGFHDVDIQYSMRNGETFATTYCKACNKILLKEKI